MNITSLSHKKLVDFITALRTTSETHELFGESSNLFGKKKRHDNQP